MVNLKWYVIYNCKISKKKAEILRIAKVIIWDESPMANRYLFEALDKTLKDIRKCDKPFGGDFRQILPVIIRGGRAQIVNSCLQKIVFIFTELFQSA